MDIYSVIKDMRLLKDCSEETLKVISRDAYHRQFDKDSLVMTPDTAIHRIAIIANKGRMKITATHQRTGEDYIAYMLSYGDIFNVTTFFDGRKDHLNAEAVDDLDILFCNIDIAREWINRLDDFNKNLLNYLSERLRMVQKFNLNRTFYSIEMRLAKLIFENIISDDNELNLLNDLSHQELAEMLGTSRAVVNRNLQKLKEDNLIDIKRKNILIHDYEKMKQYIDENNYFPNDT